MVKKLKSVLQTEIKGLHQAAYVLGAFSILSQLFALIRDRLLASTFGAGVELDIYYSAFRLPDMLFVLLSTFVAVSVLVPLIVEKREDGAELKRYFNSVFTFVTLVSLAFFSLAWIFAPYFLQTVVPEIYAGHEAALTTMTRILLLQPLLLSLSSFLGSFAQANKRFLAYATSPVVYNVGIIVGVAVLYPIYGLIGLAYGVVLGAALHAAILVPVVARDYVPRFSKIYGREIVRLIGHSIPRTFAMLSTQVLLIAMTFFAGMLAAGSIAIFNLSYNLQSVPMAIIGVSYSLAAFPSLALFFKEGKMDKFYSLLSGTIRHVFFWSLPVVALFIMLRAQIVRVILGAGNFDWNETILVAASLGIFTLSLIAQCSSQVLIRAFYAMGKTRFPFICAIASVAVTLSFLGLLLAPNLLSTDIIAYLEELFEVSIAASSLILVLPIGFTIGQWVQFLMLLIGIGGLREIFSKQFATSVSQSLAGAGIISVLSYISLNFLSGVLDLNTFFGIFAQGLIAGLVGLAGGVAFLIVIGNREVTTVLHTGLGKLKRKPVLQQEVKEEL